MAKQLNVQMNFNANTSQATTAIQELQSALAKVAVSMSSMKNSTVDSASLERASSAAKELSYHLSNALNATTGNLDLSKFDKSLKTSNSNITTLSNNLLAAGTNGQEAFIKLASAISQADRPMLRLNGMLTEMWTVLKNTARWQLSSSLLHGFIGSVQTAYHYAQDLNESLNNIRIVTGHSVSEMAQFAEAANKAARELHTTTTEYTDASLIFYQQGLNDEEVAARTEVTIKMANAAGESAKIVSDQLTAVWNNFYDGSASLESYADKMTALGAATASSTDEIATGIEKFASVADTIGLSFDYAASSLATITATTRQSADTVGTALKTLFSRMQGLKLGDTLEDGTDLTKYSAALRVAGIEIKEENGELKNMDAILDELGAKWQLLTRDQKVALAQTVAGVRQYNQLMSLMENWDFFERNLEIAQNSEGTLQKQADIYAERWEAAKDRVQASLEAIYSDLVDENFFIGLNNGLASVIDGVDDFIDSIGGLKGILGGVATILLTVLSSKISPALENLKYNISVMFNGAHAQAEKFSNEMAKIVEAEANRKITSKTGEQEMAYNIAQQQELKNAAGLIEARNKLAIASQNMTQQEKAMADFALQGIQVQQQEAQALADKLQILQETNEYNQTSDVSKSTSNVFLTYKEQAKELVEAAAEARQALASVGDNVSSDDLQILVDNFDQANAELDAFTERRSVLIENSTNFAQILREEYKDMSGLTEGVEKTTVSVESLGEIFASQVDNIRNMNDALNSVTNATQKTDKPWVDFRKNLLLVQEQLDPFIQESDQLKKTFTELWKAANEGNKQKASAALKQLETDFKDLNLNAETTARILKTLGQNVNVAKIDEAAEAMRRLKTTTDAINQSIQSFNPTHMITGLERITALAASAGQIAMLGTSMRSLVEAFDSDSTATFGERLTQVLMSLSMMVPAFTSLWSKMKTVLAGTDLEIWAYEKSLQKLMATQTSVGLTTEAITAKTSLLRLSYGQVLTEAEALTVAQYILGDAFTKDEIQALGAALANKKLSTEELAAAVAAAVEKKGLDAETVAAIKARIATEGLGTALKGLLGPFALVAIAIAGLIALLQHYKKIQEETAQINYENNKNQAESSKKIAEANREEQASIDELYTTYVNYRTKLDDSEESKNNLRTATEKLCEALGIEWDALDKLQGKYEEVNAEILKHRQQIAQENIEEAQQSANDATSALKSGVSYNISTYGKNAAFSNQGSMNIFTPGYGISLNDESAMYDAWSSFILEHHADLLIGDNPNRRTAGADGSTYFNNKVDSEVLYNLISEFMSNLKDYLGEDYGSEVAGSEVYAFFKQLAEDSDLAGYVEQRKQAEADIVTYSQDLAQILIEQTAQGLDISGIATEEQYNAYKAAFIEQVKAKFADANLSSEEYTEEYFDHLADTYLRGFDHLATIIDEAEVLDSAEDKLNNILPREKLAEIFGDYEDIPVAQIHFELVPTDSAEAAEAGLRAQLALLQNEADLNTIKVELEVVQSAQSSLKKNMTAADYRAFEADSGLAWGETDQWGNAIVQYSEFLKMSYDEQVAYLQKLENTYIEIEDEVIEITEHNYQEMSQYYSDLEAQAQAAAEDAAQRAADYRSWAARPGVTVEDEEDLLELARQADDEALAHAEEAMRFRSEAERLLNQALDTDAEAILREKEALENMCDACDVAVDEVEDLADEIQDMAESSDKLADSLKDDRKGAQLVAIAAKQTKRGLDALVDSMKDWQEAIEGDDILAATEAMAEMKDAMADVLNISDELDALGIRLGDHFGNYLKDNMDLVAQAADGDTDAIMRLAEVAAQDIYIQLGLDPAAQDQVFNEISETMDIMQQLLDSNQLQIGAVDDTALIASLNDIINATAMTVEQAEAILAGLGFDATVREVQEPMQTIHSVTETVDYQQGATISDPTGSGRTYVGAIPIPHVLETESTVEGTVSSLEVETAHYTGGGNINTQRGGTGRSGGGSKKSGGGGGSKAKEIQHADKKSDSEKERYHTLKNQLEDLSAAYDRVSNAADRAFGKDKLKLIDGEIQATQDLIDKQKEYIKAITQNLPTDKAIMEAYAQKVLGFGIQYDESGNIANYDALQDAMWAVYNARADAMDSSSTEWQVFEDEFEELQHWIEQYEETYDLLRDEEDKLQEYVDQQADLQLKKIQYAIELKLNVADDSLAVLNYQLDRLEDKAFSAAEAIALMGSKVDVLYDKVAADREGLDRILGQQLSSAEIRQIYEGDMSVLQGKHFTADQIDAIKEYRDDLLSLNEELLEIRRSVQDKVMETFDEFNEKIEDQIDLFDHYNAILENYKNIIDIVGRSYLKVDKELMKTLNQATINNLINKVKGTKDAYDALIVSQAEAEKALQEAIARGNEIDIAAWEEDLEEIQKKVNDAQENMMQAWEDALQSCAEMFEMAVEDAIDNFNKAMLPFGSLEEFQDAYDKQKEVADQYLEDYDKIYELSKLARNVNNSINDAPNIAGKQKLAKLLEKINGYQEDGVQMSEYELEYLQKEYDLRLAEIALEEAQNAKSIVRLTRDNEGNYSYSYTADTSAVDDAAQKYEDALHAMQELSSNYIDEMSDQLIDATQQMEEELAAVRVQDYASIEDYYKKIDEIQQYWLDRMGYMQGEFQKALDNNKTLYEEDWKRYADATGYKISADEDFAKSYQDTVLGKLFDSEDDIIDFQQRVNDALGDSDKGLIGELLAAYIQWQENTENAMVAAGTSSEGFAEHMEEAVSGPGGIVDQSQAATESVEAMTTQMVAGFTTIIGAVDQWQSHYSDTMDSIIAKNMSVIEAHNLLVKALSTGDSTTSTAGTQTTSTGSGSGGTGGTTGTGSGGTGGVAGTSTGSGSSGSLSVGSYVDVKSGTKWYADSHGGAPWGWARSGTIQYTADGAPLAYNIEGLGWIRKSDIVGYGSGGYTGEWGPAGRLAMLHEKEVVLNAEDSANFLSAIEIVRDLSRYIDLQAQWQSTGLGALVASAIKETDNTLQQQVNISADFPNVSDRNEIEAAFNSLINTAAQYANRKNPLSGIV